MHTHPIRSFVRLAALLPLAACASTAIGAHDDAASTDAVVTDTPPARLPDVVTTHCAAPAPVVSTGPYPADIVDWVATSGFLFAGTVTRLGASTEPSYTATPQSIAVRIDDPLVWPLGSGFQGREITWVTGTLGIPPVGYRGFFLGTTLVIGTSVVLNEQHRLDATMYSNFAAQLPAIQSFIADRALYERARDASMVIEATVESISVLPMIGPISEHSPEWAEATVRVTNNACGISTSTLPVRFNQSGDIVNIGGPRLMVGQQAILLLRPDTITHEPGEAYIVTDPRDVQTPDQWTRIVGLLNTQRTLSL